MNIVLERLIGCGKVLSIRDTLRLITVRDTAAHIRFDFFLYNLSREIVMGFVENYNFMR